MPIRTKLAFKSRHKRPRPETFELFITKNGKRESVRLPLDEFPMILPMPIFAEMPPVVTGKFDSPFPRQIGMISYGTDPASELLTQIKKKYNADQVELPPLDVSNFSRALASQTVALECRMQIPKV